MRRWLYLFLLVLLPLQSSWAVVAAYCAHEARALTHLGHHEHSRAHAAQPVAQTSALDATAPAVSGIVDLDCHHDGGCCLGVLLTHAPWSAQLRQSPVPEGSTSRLNSVIAAPPERPQWHALA